MTAVRLLAGDGDSPDARCRPDPAPVPPSRAECSPALAPPPPAVSVAPPAMSARVEPFADRLIRERLRAQPQHVAVRIRDLHLVRPGVVGGRVPDDRSLAPQLLAQR